MFDNNFKILVHCIIGTNDFKNLLDQKIEKLIYRHFEFRIKHDFESDLLAINGNENHLHLLFQLHPDKSLNEIIQSLKASSSELINQMNLTNEKFMWQIGYYGFSVSESQVEKVNDYIKNQKEIHQKLSTEDEIAKFLEAHKTNKPKN